MLHVFQALRVDVYCSFNSFPVYIYDSQLVDHSTCFNLFIFHNNLFDKQGGEINKNDISLRFDILSFIYSGVTKGVRWVRSHRPREKAWPFLSNTKLNLLFSFFFI